MEDRKSINIVREIVLHFTKHDFLMKMSKFCQKLLESKKFRNDLTSINILREIISHFTKHDFFDENVKILSKIA